MGRTENQCTITITTSEITYHCNMGEMLILKFHKCKAVDILFGFCFKKRFSSQAENS